KVRLAVRSLPVQLAVPPVADVAAFVDQKNGRPDRVAPGLPVLLLAVDSDRKREPMLAGAPANAGDDFLPFGLGGMHADHREIAFVEHCVPTLVPRVVVDTVDSTEGPEMERDDLPAKLLDRQRFGIDPIGYAAQLWCLRGERPQLRELDRLAAQLPPAVALFR